MKPWEKYATKESPAEGPWSKYAESVGAQEEPSAISMKGLARGTLQALPLAGSIAGGALGLIGGPLTAVGGAGLGAAGGKALQTIGESLMGDEKTREEVYLDPVKEGLIGASGEAGGQALAKIGSSAVKAGGKALKSGAANLTKIPEKVLDTYSKRTKEIDKLAGEFGENIPEMADSLRTKVAKQIQGFKAQQNADITKALENSSATVDVSPVKQRLLDARAKLSPKYNPEDVSKIDDVIRFIDEAHPGGEASSADAYRLQRKLQDMAEFTEPGKFFKKNGPAESAFARSSGEARALVNEAEPGIKGANKNLSKLRNIDKKINKNLITPEKPEAGLIAAGSGENQRNRKFLAELEDLTGGPILKDAEDLAATRYMGKAGALPGLNTGAATIPLALSATGSALGGISGGKEGALTGAGAGLLGSPLAVKMAIKYGPKSIPAGLKGAMSVGTREAIMEALRSKNGK